MDEKRKRIQINGKPVESMDQMKKFIYPFFAFHMLIFGLSGFLMSYASSRPEMAFIYIHGGIAIIVYIAFYLAIFGVDELKWMAINGALGLFGIYSQIGWILARFGKQIDDYPWYVHVTPFIYYVLYTFLLRQFLLDVTRSRDNPKRRAQVNNAYVLVSLLVYGWMLWRTPSHGW